MKGCEDCAHAQDDADGARNRAERAEAQLEQAREALATIAAFNSREGSFTGQPSAEASIARDALAQLDKGAGDD